MNGISIVGLAKTGTTAVSMTLCDTVKVPRMLMEPQDLADHRASRRMPAVGHQDYFRSLAEPRGHVKAPLSAQLLTMARQLRSLSSVIRVMKLSVDFTTLPMSTFPHDPPRTTIAPHGSIFFVARRRTPETIGLLEMQTQIISRFGVGFLPGRPFTTLTAGLSTKSSPRPVPTPLVAL